MDNMKLYEAARAVPENAKKTIAAGRLKGMTDINPMWRIKRLTELFGACGIGWWYEIAYKAIVEDELTKQKAAFVDIVLYYRDPDSGETSHGIAGTGGSSFVAQERNGAYLSDECFKMALTDAISVAAKALGVGADVYFDKDRTKYSDNEEEIKMETAEDAKAFVIGFGKYKGKTLEDIYDDDIAYIDWLYDNEKTDKVVKKAISILYKKADKKQRQFPLYSENIAPALSPRQRLFALLNELGFDATQFAAEKGIDKSTPDTRVLEVLAELGGNTV